MSLLDKKCVPCEGGVPPLDAAKIREYTAELKTGWTIIGTNPDEKQSSVGARKIRKEYKFKDFKEAIAFVNKVAGIAEGEGHHPDMYIMYNKVMIELTTHAIGGLSENDFILAAKIDETA